LKGIHFSTVFSASESFSDSLTSLTGGTVSVDSVETFLSLASAGASDSFWSDSGVESATASFSTSSVASST